MDTWCTPRLILDCVSDLFGEFYDPCPQGWNISRGDGLSVEWLGPAFVNPPFSKVADWARVAIEQAAGGKKIVFLGASRTSARWYGNLWDHSDAVVLLRKRVKFLDPATDKEAGSAPFDVTLFCFNVTPKRVRDCFGEIGRVVTM
jgi:hypothetical protein